MPLLYRVTLVSPLLPWWTFLRSGCMIICQLWWYSRHAQLRAVHLSSWPEGRQSSQRRDHPSSLFRGAAPPPWLFTGNFNIVRGFQSSFFTLCYICHNIQGHHCQSITILDNMLVMVWGPKSFWRVPFKEFPLVSSSAERLVSYARLGRDS